MDLKKCAAKIDQIVENLSDAWKKRRNVFVIGNGGSASTATHFAADLMKTTTDSPSGAGIKAISLDNVPLNSAIINDWGKEQLFFCQLNALFNPEDLLVVFSVHGGAGSDKAGLWSQNLVQAINFAKDKRGLTIGFSGFDGGIMAKICDISLVVPVNSTPLVESFHLWLSHLITFRLKELMNERQM